MGVDSFVGVGPGGGFVENMKVNGFVGTSTRLGGVWSGWSFVDNMKGFLEKLYLLEILDSRFDFYEINEDDVIKSSMMFALTGSFVGDSSLLMRSLKGEVEDNLWDEDINVFIRRLKGMLSWGNRRLYLWKI